MGTRSPSVPFERAEFVRADQTYSILHRIVRATQVDTIVHTFLVVDSTLVPTRALHEINVIGTMNLLAAAGAPGSPVRHVVVKSSTLVYGSSEKDPNTFSEDSPRSSPPRTRVERSLVDVEGAGSGLRRGQPVDPGDRPALRQRAGHRHRDLDQQEPLPTAVPGDPRLRPAGAVRRGGRRRPGPRARHPPAGPGPLQRGRRRSPAVERGGLDLRDPAPPAPAGKARSGHRPARPARDSSSCPPSSSRSCDTDGAWTLAAWWPAGFDYRYTSAGAVQSFIRAVRLRRGAGRPPASYTYEHDVEQFFRHSPSVVQSFEA